MLISFNRYSSAAEEAILLRPPLTALPFPANILLAKRRLEGAGARGRGGRRARGGGVRGRQRLAGEEVSHGLRRRPRRQAEQRPRPARVQLAYPRRLQDKGVSDRSAGGAGAAAAPPHARRAHRHAGAAPLRRQGRGRRAQGLGSPELRGHHKAHLTRRLLVVVQHGGDHRGGHCHLFALLVLAEDVPGQLVERGRGGRGRRLHPGPVPAAAAAAPLPAAGHGQGHHGEGGVLAQLPLLPGVGQQHRVARGLQVRGPLEHVRHRERAAASGGQRLALQSPDAAPGARRLRQRAHQRSRLLGLRVAPGVVVLHVGVHDAPQAGQLHPVAWDRYWVSKVEDWLIVFLVVDFCQESIERGLH
mmetsp:Transcript_31402/g.54435  ORF Transcript_31402/g.54435 Transcript_31402/m.54435 type:complete len:359 (+) Transcript_31402:298-1374(+)